MLDARVVKKGCYQPHGLLPQGPEKSRVSLVSEHFWVRVESDRGVSDGWEPDSSQLGEGHAAQY